MKNMVIEALCGDGVLRKHFLLLQPLDAARLRHPISEITTKFSAASP